MKRVALRAGAGPRSPARGFLERGEVVHVLESAVDAKGGPTRVRCAKGWAIVCSERDGSARRRPSSCARAAPPRRAAPRCPLRRNALPHAQALLTPASSPLGMEAAQARMALVETARTRLNTKTEARARRSLPATLA